MPIMSSQEEGRIGAVDRLTKKTPLRRGATQRQAADLIFVLTGPECYRSFVLDAGWTHQQSVRWEAELFVTTSYFYLGRFMRRARSYKTDQDLWKRSGRSTSGRPLTRRLFGQPELSRRTGLNHLLRCPYVASESRFVGHVRYSKDSTHE
jgi:hypothetical protein